MKLGVISDVHADLKGLLMALRILRREGVERVLCAGDLVERGGEGDEVVRVVRQGRILCVQGNHDYSAAGNQAWLRQHGDPSNPALRKRLLSDESLHYLSQLPPRLSFSQDGVRVGLAHGAPWSDMVYIFPNSPDYLLERAACEAQADILILGHTHIPMWISVGGVWIANPGSVCVPGSRTCATLDLPECIWRVFDIVTGKVVEGPSVG